MRPASHYANREMVWHPGRSGVRYRCKIALPYQCDAWGNWMFVILEGPLKGTVTGIPSRELGEGER